jgi:hypothetical protein
MQMETNESGDTYQPTIYMEIDKSSPFVPWLRANYNLTDPLPEDNSVVKIVTSEE